MPMGVASPAPLWPPPGAIAFPTGRLRHDLTSLAEAALVGMPHDIKGQADQIGDISTLADPAVVQQLREGMQHPD